MNDIEKAVAVAEKAVELFTGRLHAAESKLLNEILTMIKQLRTGANGNIDTSVDNLKSLNAIKVNLGKIFKDASYVDDVAKFANAFKSIEKYQDSYFTGIGSVTKKELLKEVGRATVNELVDELAGTGLDRILRGEIIGELRGAILSGESYSELVKRLQNIQSTATNAGLLSKYSGVYARDAINDFMGRRNKIIGEDLGVE
jgi:hypothetical protein